ncbi:S66 family peptidase [Deefgea rivuli]|uniref:S66 family peptidase n=1 Tax=Deefgea rivuli TaxID=400948 RepID=UPI0004881381|nr:S66 peptidase family protein [Deefgea rivuli]
MKSEKLKHGDKVCVIAPSRSLGIISQQVIELATTKLNEIGLEVCFSKHVNEIDEFQSSSVDSRIEDLHTAFSDKTVKGILTAIGGHNSIQLLNKIDYAIIKANPKILCGFSDITALSNAIYAKTKLITYSGPHFSTLGMLQGLDYTIDYFKKCLMSEDDFSITHSQHWSDDAWYINQNQRDFYPNTGYQIINTGEASGTMIGGNLCTFNLLQGSCYLPEPEDTILFLEEDNLLGENTLTEFDRNLQSIIHLKSFHSVKGIVIGRFQKASQITHEQICKLIRSKPELNSIPVIANLDFGHTTPQITFPIGGEVEIIATSTHCEITIKNH